MSEIFRMPAQAESDNLGDYLQLVQSDGKITLQNLLTQYSPLQPKLKNMFDRFLFAGILIRENEETVPAERIQTLIELLLGLNSHTPPAKGNRDMRHAIENYYIGGQSREDIAQDYGITGEGLRKIMQRQANRVNLELINIRSTVALASLLKNSKPEVPGMPGLPRIYLTQNRPARKPIPLAFQPNADGVYFLTVK